MHAACLFILLTACRQLWAQHPVFAEMPDSPIRLVAAHPEMPVQTSFDISVIETNAPSYMASFDKMERRGWLNTLIAAEEERLKPSPDLRRYWYEFVQATALTEQEMDAIAHNWWSASGNRAVKHAPGDEPENATFEEVRAHFETLRVGVLTRAMAAKRWLMTAGTDGTWERLRIPTQAQAISPLAHLLARDIAEEAEMYTGPEALKLRKTLQSLLVGKFTLKGNDGITRPVSAKDVDALLVTLASGEDAPKADAKQRLEEWLTRAIDADLLKSARDAARRRQR